MSRYIDADALKKRVSELIVPEWTRTLIGSWVDAEPTVDAAQVVRCRECKYAHLTYDGDIKYCDLLAVKDEDGECDPCFYRSGDWFCADGERRSDD